MKLSLMAFLDKTKFVWNTIPATKASGFIEKNTTNKTGNSGRNGVSYPKIVIGKSTPILCHTKSVGL